MKKFNVGLGINITLELTHSLTIEAESEEEAVKIAKRLLLDKDSNDYKNLENTFEELISEECFKGSLCWDSENVKLCDFWAEDEGDEE